MRFDNFPAPWSSYDTWHLCIIQFKECASLPFKGGTKTRSLGGKSSQMFAQMLTASALDPTTREERAVSPPPSLLDRLLCFLRRYLTRVTVTQVVFFFFFFNIFKQPPPPTWNCFAPGRTSRRRRQLSRVLSPSVCLPLKLVQTTKRLKAPRKHILPVSSMASPPLPPS